MPFNLTGKTGIDTGFSGKVEGRSTGKWSFRRCLEAFGWLCGPGSRKKDLSWVYRFCNHQHIHRIVFPLIILAISSKSTLFRLLFF